MIHHSSFSGVGVLTVWNGQSPAVCLGSQEYVVCNPYWRFCIVSIFITQLFFLLILYVLKIADSHFWFTRQEQQQLFGSVAVSNWDQITRRSQASTHTEMSAILWTKWKIHPIGRTIIFIIVWLYALLCYIWFALWAGEHISSFVPKYYSRYISLPSQSVTKFNLYLHILNCSLKMKLKANIATHKHCQKSTQHCFWICSHTFGNFWTKLEKRWKAGSQRYERASKCLPLFDITLHKIRICDKYFSCFGAIALERQRCIPIFWKIEA